MKVLVLAGAAALLTGCSGGALVPTPSPSPKSLSHTTVEDFIREVLDDEVICNNGQDFPLRHDGDTFECRNSEKVFEVTITDKDKGKWDVVRVS